MGGNLLKEPPAEWLWQEAPRCPYIHNISSPRSLSLSLLPYINTGAKKHTHTHERTHRFMCTNHTQSFPSGYWQSDVMWCAPVPPSPSLQDGHCYVLCLGGNKVYDHNFINVRQHATHTHTHTRTSIGSSDWLGSAECALYIGNLASLFSDYKSVSRNCFVLCVMQLNINVDFFSLKRSAKYWDLFCDRKIALSCPCPPSQKKCWFQTSFASEQPLRLSINCFPESFQGAQFAVFPPRKKTKTVI